MRCPFCQTQDTRVIDSRLASEGDQVRRRRECGGCSERFTTYESAELLLPRVVKRDGTRVQFDEQRLRNGMMRALEKRPVATEAVEAALSRIRQRVQALGDGEVNASTIGDWVMEELRELDEVAYVRFASVYRSFQDVSAFREVIEGLEDRDARLADNGSSS
ncbi:NrdR family transcriptional regulator [Spiribacter curvatus]|uniref:Transcriptional repressor NrdR n=1 Tax=Spiribacter curvatus TaxID=1335757 RepID=U5T1S1_9GAMM|nr:transcriptional regulator NrdR [Spiribacter curvatus]AGY91499.1 NrdR family transcriptional regulator [Spiribacter curvatus]